MNDDLDQLAEEIAGNFYDKNEFLMDLGSREAFILSLTSFIRSALEKAYQKGGDDYSHDRQLIDEYYQNKRPRKRKPEPWTVEQVSGRFPGLGYVIVGERRIGSMNLEVAKAIADAHNASISDDCKMR